MTKSKSKKPRAKPAIKSSPRWNKKPRPQRKEMELPTFGDLVSDKTPFLYYQVQELLQKAGYLLIDLETGSVISGQVNLPQIGLVDTVKSRPLRRHMGFIPPLQPETMDFSKSDVDGILCSQGDDEPGQPALFIIDFVDSEEIEQ